MYEYYIYIFGGLLYPHSTSPPFFPSAQRCRRHAAERPGVNQTFTGTPGEFVHRAFADAHHWQHLPWGSGRPKSVVS